MQEFKDTIPFDPGYSDISFNFLGHIDTLIEDYIKLKAPHQKKFWLSTSEQKIIELINKSTAFYLGCLLWGSFIHNRFKQSPKTITGNNIAEKTKEELKDFDCSYEVKAILDYVKFLERDFKYLMKRSIKIPQNTINILNTYIEFADLNNNFLKVKTTADIKLPKALDYFSKMTDSELDALCKNIYSTIESKNIENLLSLDANKL